MELYVRISEINANRRYLKTSKMDLEIYRSKLKAQVMNGATVDVEEYLGKCEIPRIKASLDILRFLGVSELTILKAKRKKYADLARRYRGYIDEEVKEINNMPKYLETESERYDAFNRGALTVVYKDCETYALNEVNTADTEIKERTKK